MRSLPEFPNLAFLRQEAKDALDSLRETQPGASLADAQRLLAEQYGYRTWTELKAEVERRRSGTKDAADPELADRSTLTYPQSPRSWRSSIE